MSAIINIFDNPIEKKYRTVKVDTPCRVGDVVKSNNPEYCLVYVNGSQRDLDTMLIEGDICTVRQFAGSSAGEFFMNLVVPGYTIFKPVIKAGLKKLASWLIGKPDKATDTDSEQGEKTPTISGCKNGSSDGKTIPFILGKTLMTPYLIGQPYTTIDTSTDKGESYFHGLYLVGYNKLQIRNISLGNYVIAPNDGSGGCVSQNDYTTAQTSDLESGFPAVKKTGAFYPPASYQPKVEIQQGSSEVSLYPQKVIQENFGDVISGKAFGDNYFNFFSARYPHKVEVQIKFPNGLIGYTKKGKKKNHTVNIWLGMSRNGGSTWEPFAYFNRVSDSAATSTASKSVFTRQTKDEMNFVATRTFSYNEVKNATNNTIEFRIQVGYSESSDEQYIHDVVIDSVRTWCYDPDASKSANSIVVQRPMVASRRNRTARIGLQIKATEDIQNTLDQLNCICTSKGRTWNGSAWSSGVSPTNNPASLILLAMQGVCRGNKPYPNSRIDFASLGAFYAWCADTSTVGDSLPRFHCNGAVLNRVKSSDLIRQIASCGRGSIGINGDKYCVEIDSPRSVHVMVLNEQNILEQTNRKEFAELPEGFECRFVNALDYYQDDSLVVWFDTTTHPDPADRVLETVEYPFITDAKRVVRQAWYDYACRKLRPETWEVKVATEGNLINPGDLVEIQGSSISVGISEGAEITSLITEGDYITGIMTDGSFYVSDLSNTYGCRITLVDTYGNTAIINKKVIFTQTGTHRRLNFETSISLNETKVPCVGDIVSFGIYQSETADALCVGKKDNGDGTFSLSLTPYQAGIYTAETGKVPEYDSKITPPRTSGLPINKGYATLDDVNNALELAMDGDEDTIPPDVTQVIAIATENGLELSCICGRSYLTESITFKYQIKRGNDAEWADINAAGGFYRFNRSSGADGYPEASTLSGWNIRAKAVNAYGNESENWTTGTINTDNYGTWIVQTPAVASGTLKLDANGRSFHIECKQPSSLNIYGNVRYRISIKRYDDNTYFCPNITNDPYGNENAYKDTGAANNYLLCTNQFTQTVPLEGQSTNAPAPTLYYYVITPENEAGAGTPTSALAMTAYPVGAKDVVLAHKSDGTMNTNALTAENIYAENLYSISAVFAQIMSGGADPNHIWDMEGDEFRVGNNRAWEEQGDDRAQYIHYKNSQLSMKLQNLYLTTIGAFMKGALSVIPSDQTPESHNLRHFITEQVSLLQRFINGAWKTETGMSWAGVETSRLFKDGTLVIGNADNAGNGSDTFGYPYPSSSSKVYHFDQHNNDQNGSSEITISGTAERVDETDHPTTTEPIDFKPLYPKIAPYTTVQRFLFGHYSITVPFTGVTQLTLSFLLKFIWGENQLLFEVSVGNEHVRMYQLNAEPYYNVPDTGEPYYNNEVEESLALVYNEVSSGGGRLVHNIGTQEEELAVPTLTSDEWYHVALVVTQGQIKLYLDTTEYDFTRFTSGTQNAEITLNTWKNLVGIDELMFDTTKALTLSEFTAFSAENIPWGSLDADDNYLILNAKDPTKVKSNCFYKKSEVYTKTEVDNNIYKKTDVYTKSEVNTKLGDGSVTKVAQGAINSTALDSSAVIESKIANDAVTTDKVKNNSITNDKVAQGIKMNKLNSYGWQKTGTASVNGGSFNIDYGPTTDRPIGSLPYWLIIDSSSYASFSGAEMLPDGVWRYKFNSTAENRKGTATIRVFFYI